MNEYPSDDIEVFITHAIMTIRGIFYSAETDNDFNNKITTVDDGYDKVLWGASADDVKKLYYGLEDNTDDNSRKQDIILLNQHFAKEDIMTYRHFEFYKNELYAVRVVFDNINEKLEYKIFEKFIEKYGNFDNSVDLNYFLDDSKEIVVIGKRYIRSFSPELTIFFDRQDRIMYKSGTGISHENIYDYFNPIILDKIQDDTANNIIEDINI